MPPQIPRLILVFAVLIVGFFAVRSQTVPASFGEKGFYRANFPVELAKRPLAHAGKQACLECHSTKPDMTKHYKAGVSCESCHGPSQKHVEDSEHVMPFKPVTREACGRCHASIIGRRSTQPQIDMKDHHPEKPCISCHAIHSEEAAK